MNKINDFINQYIKGDKRFKILIITGVAALLLLLIADSVPSKNEKNNEEIFNLNNYCNTVESDTEELISSIKGVGRCKVMITFENTQENVYAKNSEQNYSDSSNSKKDEYVLYDGQDGDNPVLINQYYPKVQGVAVVCDGADITSVRESIINALSSLFNLSVTKISVSKYKG